MRHNKEKRYVSMTFRGEYILIPLKGGDFSEIWNDEENTAHSESEEQWHEKVKDECGYITVYADGSISGFCGNMEVAVFSHGAWDSREDVQQFFRENIEFASEYEEEEDEATTRTE